MHQIPPMSVEFRQFVRARLGFTDRCWTFRKAMAFLHLACAKECELPLEFIKGRFPESSVLSMLTTHAIWFFYPHTDEYLRMDGEQLILPAANPADREVSFDFMPLDGEGPQKWTISEISRPDQARNFVTHAMTLSLLKLWGEPDRYLQEFQRLATGPHSPRVRRIAGEFSRSE